MQAEAIIAASISAICAGGGVPLARRILGSAPPSTDAEIAAYYRQVIENLIMENQELHKEVGELSKRVRSLELAQDEPPSYLG